MEIDFRKLDAHSLQLAAKAIEDEFINNIRKSGTIQKAIKEQLPILDNMDTLTISCPLEIDSVSLRTILRLAGLKLTDTGKEKR